MSRTIAGPDASRHADAPPPAHAAAASLPAARASTMAASTTEQLRRFGRAYPAAGRAFVSVVCAATAPFAGPPLGFAVAAAVAVGIVAWHLGLLVVLLPRRPAPRWLGWLYGVDVSAKCVLCLAQPLLVAPALLAAGSGWVAPIVSFALVSAQFALRPLPAAVATAAMPVAFVAGVAAAPGLTVWDGVTTGGAWMVVEAVLARLLWQLLVRGARGADLVLAARLRAEREAVTAAARRAGQRAHWATVHDTSASTLLMIGLGQVTGAEAWLPGQVRRDIDLLDGRRADDEGDVDLGARVRAAAEQARVRVDVECPDPVALPAPVAEAVAGAVAEALENVHRHAGTGAAIVALRRASGPGAGVEVVVADTGRGFDPSAVGPRRFGLRRSVHDRMTSVGGSAEVESAPERGTVVRLHWTERRGAAAVPVGPSAAGDDTFLADALLRALQVGRSAIVLTILLGLAVPAVLVPSVAPRVGLVWLATLTAVAVTDAVLVVRRRSWGRARWPVAVGVLAVSAWTVALLPAAPLGGPLHRTVGLVGWFGVLLFGDRGVRPLVGFLAAHAALTLGLLAATGRLDTGTLLDVTVVLAVTAGFQLTTGAAGASLVRLAAAAIGMARRQATRLTAEAVAQQLHADREERYARLRESVLPLLRGVGDGSLSPQDPDVQRRAAVEAARLRRLFAEDGDTRDPLAAELGALVDVVERRGTAVRYAERGQWPVPPPPVCRALVGEIGDALLSARSGARVTLSAVGTGVAVSVVSDAGTGVPGPSTRSRGTDDGQITTTTVEDEQRIWVEARWAPSAS